MPTPGGRRRRLGRHLDARRSRRRQTYGIAGSDGRFQLFAVLESTRRKSWRIVLKTDSPTTTCTRESWVAVYPGADWHEREAWEMYGFAFDGHPSLRHLYLPSEFEGHPLRKDFPLLAREVKPWPGLVDVEPMPGEAGDETAAAPEADGRWRRMTTTDLPPPGELPEVAGRPRRCSAISPTRR